MMGPKQEAQAALFYEFSLEGHVPQDPLLTMQLVGDRSLSAVRQRADRGRDKVIDAQLGKPEDFMHQLRWECRQRQANERADGGLSHDTC